MLVWHVNDKDDINSGCVDASANSVEADDRMFMRGETTVLSFGETFDNVLIYTVL